eukprot:353037-Chlamydomonas_euryale.AAC.2
MGWQVPVLDGLAAEMPHFLGAVSTHLARSQAAARTWRLALGLRGVPVRSSAVECAAERAAENELARGARARGYALCDLDL